LGHQLFRSIDLRHPFFVPLWRRIALVVLLASWTLIESLIGHAFWAVVIGFLGIYSAYIFFFNFSLTESKNRQKDKF
jgi:positive regulator of sigma E activity